MSENNPLFRIQRNIESATDPEIQAHKADKISLYWEKTGSFTDVFIKAFFRAGRLVRAHYRRKRNATDTDNYTTKGNINPYTERKGTKPAKRIPLIYDRSDANHPDFSETVPQSAPTDPSDLSVPDYQPEPDFSGTVHLPIPPTPTDTAEREVNHHSQAIETDINTTYEHDTNSPTTHHLSSNQSN